MTRRGKRGFTLVELMVTLAVLGLLATIVVPVAQVARQREHEAELRRDLRDLRDAIDAYHRASVDGRVARAATATDWPPALQVLVDGVRDQQDPNGGKLYFLRRLPRDPMAVDPALTDAQTWGLRSYASEASDPQEGDDVYDVHSRSTATGLDGVPYDRW